MQQQTICKGQIFDRITKKPLPSVKIMFKGTKIATESNINGLFSINQHTSIVGEQIIIISHPEYHTKMYPIFIIESKVLVLPDIELDYDFKKEQSDIGIISLTDEELEEDGLSAINTSGLLSASRDVFLNAAAFDFSSTFFRPRGLDGAYGKVLINGIEMNKVASGRPQWSNWGGINDVQRNQEFSLNTSAHENSFGDAAGTTNIIMRASQYSAGGRISYAMANRSYTGRVMATYSSGVNLNGWAYVISLSRRFGQEGIIEGTLYDANAIFTSVEKKINEEHSLNLTSFYTPNRRGKSAPVTSEVLALRGDSYNPNWGYYKGAKKNSKIRIVEEPVVMLNHYWKMNTKTILATSIGLQTGKTGNSRIDTNGTDFLLINGVETYLGGGRSQNTTPTHPANLPSFYVQNKNPSSLEFQNAFLAQQEFVNNGQLNWDGLINGNQIQANKGKNGVYALFEDRTDDTQWTFNSTMKSQLNPNISLQASLNYRNLRSENFAEITNLLGGSGFLDVDAFALNDEGFSLEALANRAQSDLQNRNRIVFEGDRYDYNYTLYADIAESFVQVQLNYNWFDLYLAGKVSRTSYQREGLFENGYFPGTESLGKSEKQNFINGGIKGGLTIKIDGRHSIVLNTSFASKAPTLRNSFANARKNNEFIFQLSSPKILSSDIGYILRTPKINLRGSAYYIDIRDDSEVGFFFTETLANELVEETAAFVQENLTGVHKKHFGAELGLKYKLTSTYAIKAAASIGQHTYRNDPDLDLSTDDGRLSLGKAALNNYKLANGPQQVVQIGMEYRDPDFWWLGITANYFSNAYSDVSAFKRTENFNLDPENGLPFNDYDPTIAKSLLQQEQFSAYTLVNFVGGSSWRVKNYYVGFFAAINNVLNTQYITGGFEQARRANYRTSLEEANRETPIFGNKYFFGSDTSYYATIYLKF